MTAQDIYDSAAFDGEQRHYILNELTGDPSPAGRTPIDRSALTQLEVDCRAIAAQHGTRAPTADAIRAFLALA